MVSMTMRSAPAAAPALTTWAKMSTAVSKSRMPVGSSSCPVGPISRATRARPWAASLARATAAGTISSTVFPQWESFSRLAPKVLA